MQVVHTDQAKMCHNSNYFEVIQRIDEFIFLNQRVRKYSSSWCISETIDLVRWKELGGWWKRNMVYNASF